MRYSLAARIESTPEKSWTGLADIADLESPHNKLDALKGSRRLLNPHVKLSGTCHRMHGRQQIRKTAHIVRYRALVGGFEIRHQQRRNRDIKDFTFQIHIDNLHRILTRD